METICQSCGMPLRRKEDFGTNRDGSKSKEYCFHCYQKGRFLDEGITLQEKIDKNVKFGVMMGMKEAEAREIRLPGMAARRGTSSAVKPNVVNNDDT